MFLDELANVLAAVQPTDLFLGQMPDKPDLALSITETPGSEGDAVHGTPGVKYERSRAQIRVRDAKYTTARNRIQEVYDAINLIENRYILGIWYLKLAPLQSPFLLQRDENNRFILAFNLEALKALP